jgi:Zn-dependent protease with chaperone function
MSDYSGLSSVAVSLAVNLIVVGAFFAAGITLAFRLARTLSPRLRYLAALAAFLAAAALPINSTLFGAREPGTALPPAADARPGRQPSIADAVLKPAGESAVDNPGEADVPAGAPALTVGTRPEPPGRIHLLLSTFVRLSAESRLGVGFLCLWAFVAILLLGREVFGYVHLARARKTWQLAGPEVLDELGWPGPYPLFISEHEGPYTVGLFRPAVVMHAGLLKDVSSDGARLIARHELAHARWRDPLANAVVRVVRALLWPSPPLWFLARVIRVEREAASDHSAVAASRHKDAGGAAAEYATLLVAVARLSGGGSSGRRQYHWAATEAGDHVDLERRVLRLLMFHPGTARARLLLAALVLTATVWGVVSLPAAARPAPAAPDPKGADIAAVEVDETLPAGPGHGPRHAASQNVFPATADENPRPAFGDQLTRKGLAWEAAESATAAQPGNHRGRDHNAAARELTPPAAAAGRGEADRDIANEMAAFGYSSLSPEQLAAMRAYGVSAAYVTEMAASGYGGLDADALINFRLLGINPAYVAELSRLGYGGLPANTVIDFRLYGVSPAYISELAAQGLSQVPAGKLVAFRRLGIDARYVKQIRSEISGGLSPDQFVALRKLGVTGGHIRELKARGIENPTAERVIDAHTQKVAAGTSAVRGDTDNE